MQDYDTQEPASGLARTIHIRRGSFQLHPGAVSYVQADNPERATVYIFTEGLEVCPARGSKGWPLMEPEAVRTLRAEIEEL